MEQKKFINIECGIFDADIAEKKKINFNYIYFENFRYTNNKLDKPKMILAESKKEALKMAKLNQFNEIKRKIQNLSKEINVIEIYSCYYKYFEENKVKIKNCLVMYFISLTDNSLVNNVKITEFFPIFGASFKDPYIKKIEKLLVNSNFSNLFYNKFEANSTIVFIKNNILEKCSFKFFGNSLRIIYKGKLFPYSTNIENINKILNITKTENYILLKNINRQCEREIKITQDRANDIQSRRPNAISFLELNEQIKILENYHEIILNEIEKLPEEEKLFIKIED